MKTICIASYWPLIFEVHKDEKISQYRWENSTERFSLWEMYQLLRFLQTPLTQKIHWMPMYQLYSPEGRMRSMRFNPLRTGQYVTRDISVYVDHCKGIDTEDLLGADQTNSIVSIRLSEQLTINGRPTCSYRFFLQQDGTLDKKKVRSIMKPIEDAFIERGYELR